MKDQEDSPKARRPAALGWFLGDLHKVATQASSSIALRSDFQAFGGDFGRFWGTKMDAKIDFSDVFFDVFFERVLASILDRFLEAPKPENMHGA